MQRGTVQAIPATFPETLTTPSKIAQKASLLDMLNDICVSQAAPMPPLPPLVQLTRLRVP